MSEESIAIVPVSHPAGEAARAMALSVRQISGAELLTYDAAQLRNVQRQMYRAAQKAGVLRELKQAVIECGTPAAGAGAMVWAYQPHAAMRIEATLDDDYGLCVRLNDVTVCDDRARVKSNIVFAPGDWMAELLSACQTYRWELEQARLRTQEAEALTLVRQIKVAV